MRYSLILKIVSPFILFLALLPPTLVQTGCANMAPPTGGPRDSLPPHLVGVRPPDSAKNFKGKRIVIEFDEYVQLDNIQENLLVSPVPKVNPIVESKLRTVTVTIKDTLQANTTYSIDFGKAIKDINEGNILKNFTYLFTTGSAIDSLQLKGKVIIAETGKTDSTLIVMLHTNMDDSALIKEKPKYIARVDGNGEFNFRNLPSGTFAMYALKDEGGQRRYLSKSQLFAFLDSVVTPSVTPEPVTLYAFTEKEEEETKPKTTAPRAGGRNAAATKKAAQDMPLRFETNLSNNEVELLGPLELRFNTPLKYFDSSKVQFTTGEEFKPITNYRFTTDTSNTKVTLTYNWTENTVYNLVIDTLFAEDTLGRKLTATDTLSFRSKKQSEYGLVRLRLLNLDLSKNPVLQFVQNDQVKFAQPMTSREFYARLFLPGEYDLRILYDENKNGVWDSGQFFGEHRQPEKVTPLSRKLTVKANWDNLVDITL